MQTINLTLFAATFQQWQSNKLANVDATIQHNQKEIERSQHWIDLCEHAISKLCELLPHGSGFDNGTEFIYEKSRHTKLMFKTSFHHSDESGYTVWTDHTIMVQPDFGGYDLFIGGPDTNNIQDYLYDTFHAVFTCTTHEQMIAERKEMFETKTGIYAEK